MCIMNCCLSVKQFYIEIHWTIFDLTATNRGTCKSNYDLVLAQYVISRGILWMYSICKPQISLVIVDFPKPGNMRPSS